MQFSSIAEAMAEQEQQRVVYAEPRVVNFLSAMLPTLEGLYFVTTLDGKMGKLLLRFHASQAEQVSTLCDWLADYFPGGFHLE